MRARVIIGIVIGLLAIYYFAVPNFINWHRHDPRNACINNLRLLDSAKQQLELKTNLPPGTVVEPKQIQPFLSRGQEGVFPKCPAGGTYTLNPIGQLPTCSIKDHVLVP